jgi:hypothetical protein
LTAEITEATEGFSMFRFLLSVLGVLCGEFVGEAD